MPPRLAMPLPIIGTAAPPVAPGAAMPLIITGAVVPSVPGATMPLPPRPPHANAPLAATSTRTATNANIVVFFISEPRLSKVCVDVTGTGYPGAAGRAWSELPLSRL